MNIDEYIHISRDVALQEFQAAIRDRDRSPTSKIRTFHMSLANIFARHQPNAPYSTRSETREYNHDFPAEGVPNVTKKLNTQLHFV